MLHFDLYFTSIMFIDGKRNEYFILDEILTQLKDIIKREDKRDMMYQHLTISCYSLLTEEIIPLLENELDYDPTSDDPGEPPITMDEMHTAAWKEHQEAHR